MRGGGVVFYVSSLVFISSVVPEKEAKMSVKMITDRRTNDGQNVNKNVNLNHKFQWTKLNSRVFMCRIEEMIYQINIFLLPVLNIIDKTLACCK